jgi:hypothetical protein
MSMPNSGRSGACRRSTAAGVNSDGASSGENLTLSTGSEGGSRPLAEVQISATPAAIHAKTTLEIALFVADFQPGQADFGRWPSPLAQRAEIEATISSAPTIALA